MPSWMDSYLAWLHAYENAANLPGIYLDPKGIPTFGPGLALGHWEDGAVQLLPYAEAQAKLTTPSGAQVALSPVAWARLPRLLPEANAGDVVIPCTAPAPVLDALIRARLDDYWALACAWVPTLPRQPDAVQRAVLDLAYRGGSRLVGPNVRAALAGNALGKFVFELKYASNGDGLAGNDIRMADLAHACLPLLTPAHLAELAAAIRTNRPKVAAVEARLRRLAGRHPRAAAAGLGLTDDGRLTDAVRAATGA
jgi:hypothetical protein